MATMATPTNILSKQQLQKFENYVSDKVDPNDILPYFGAILNQG